MASPPDPKRLRPVVNWLLTGCVLIACMVVIGGITRLTGSGLSITEWKPIMGALPPMDDAEWEVAFGKYQRIPEYTLRNSHMDLAGFKRIYFWEYLHRNWGRMMGLVFFVPFVIFWRRGLLTGWLRARSWAILIGGGLVGALGWFMVASGLQDLPDVSHYRLAVHLCAAFAVFALVLWTVHDIGQGRRAFRGDATAAARWARWLLVLLLVQIVWGAFTAGLDAGRSYNTWPLMNGAFMPENVMAFDSAWTNFTHHKDGVQFIHRNLAWLVAAGMLWFAWRHGRQEHLRRPARWLAAALLLQFTLGVFTILTQVHIVLGVLHQFGALLLLAALLQVVHRTGAPVKA
ncbi:MAG: COX15/CtaA family protein [Flavobacteriales bacterium]|jgi:cytochrome c oxidase assembly protein subunit 15|nr:COX15/CtaA family protein [Flavobacteriales bacterium]